MPELNPFCSTVPEELDLPSVLVFLWKLILEEPTNIWRQDVVNFKIWKFFKEQVAFLFVQRIIIKLVQDCRCHFTYCVSDVSDNNN